MKRGLNTIGFTLIEVLLSIAIITIIAGMAIPVYLNFQTRNDLDIAANTLVQSLRRAQVLAQNMDHDNVWGVHLETGSITVFQGSSFLLREADYDEVFSLPTNMAISGSNEYVFEKLTGTPLSIGTTTLTSVDLETRTITLNEKGTVIY